MNYGQLVFHVQWAQNVKKNIKKFKGEKKMEETKKKKPKCKLVGQDGNIFNLGGIASQALKKAGQHKAAKEMVNKMFGAGSYSEALNIISEYVDVS